MGYRLSGGTQGDRGEGFLRAPLRLRGRHGLSLLYYVRADGYTPNRAVLYPEGKDGPAVEIGSTRRMLYDSPKSTHRNVPTYFYGASGSYRPAIVLVNDAGWRPDGKTISSDLVEMAQSIVVP